MNIELPTAANPVTIVEGDCLSVLQSLLDGCVDAVVTDPPYGQTNERYDGPKVASLRPEVWTECLRVCKPNTALVSFAGSPTYHRIAGAIEAGGWKVRQMWGWVYRDGLITSAYPREGFDRLAPAMTPIVYATRGKVLLNVDREGEPWSVRFPKADRHKEISGRSAANRCREDAPGHWPRSFVSDGSEPFEYFMLSHNQIRSVNGGHPNEKPIALMRWLVAKLPGELVLDPFAGSGTTGVAAVMEGRRAILIERDAKYCEMARRRVAAALGKGSLFADVAPQSSATRCR